MKIITNLKKAFRDIPKKGKHNITKILCLGVGVSVGSILIAKIYFEQSYDTFYENSDQLYQIREIVNKPNENNNYPTTPGGIAQSIKRYAPQVLGATRFTYIANYKSVIESEDKKRFSTNSIALADSSIFDVIERRIIAGDFKASLSRKNYCAIPQSLAETMGGDVIGQQILLTTAGNKKVYIGSVYEDFPENSQFRNLGILISINSIADYMMDGKDELVGNDIYTSIVKLADGTTPESLEGSIDKMIQENLPVEEIKKAGLELDFKLMQLSDVYTKNESVQRTTWILSLLAFILLFSVSMNYLLIIIGQMITRSREMAIHKCFGAENNNIHGMIFTESLVHMLISIIIAGIIIFIFNGTIQNILNTSIDSLLFNKGILIIVAVCLIMLFVTGVIPGWLYSKIPVATAFRGYKENKRRWKLILLAIQFTAAGFLLSLLVLIGRQYNYMVNDNPGYNYENIAIVSIDGATESERNNALHELGKIGSVKEVTSARALLTNQYQYGNNIFLPGQEEQLFNICDLGYCGDGYLKTMEIPIIQGSDFTTNADSTLNEVMVDRKFVEKMKSVAGWNDNIIGRTVEITGQKQSSYTICGVFENIRIGSITFPDTRPTILFHSNATLPNILVKFHSLDDESISNISERLEKLLPNKEITIKSYRSEITNLYRDSKNFRTSVLTGGIVTLIIAIIGLIGYTNDEINRRRKEIAIRKVNGGEVKNILSLFMKDILRIALPSLIIGGLGAAFVSGKWLQQFSEKVSLNPIVFIGCGFTLLIIIMMAVNINCYKVANSNPVNYLKGE